MTVVPSGAPPPDAADPGPRTSPWLRHPASRVLVIVVLFVVIQAAAVGSAYAVGGISPLVGGIVGAAVALGVYAAAVRVLERRAPVEIDIRAAPRGLLVGAVWGVGLFALTLGAIAASGGYRVTGAGSAGGVLALLGLAVYAGFVEELVFRGVLFRVVEGMAGTWIALLVSAVAFGGVHLLNPNATVWGATAVAVEAGLLLAAAYVVTRRLWVPIGLHVAWNFTQGGVFGVEISGSGAGSQGLLRGELSGPVWVSGGAFGAEASIFAVVFCAAAAAFLLRRAARAGQIRPFAPGRRSAADRGR